MAEDASVQTNVGFRSDYFVSHYGQFSGTPFRFDTSNGATQSRTNSRVGYKNPAYRSLIKQGLNATTLCNGTKFEFDSSFNSLGYTSEDIAHPTTEWTTDENYGHFAFPVPFGAIPPDTDTRAEVTNRCIRKFLEAADSARSSVEAGQDLGEIHQTIESIVRPMQSMRDLIKGHYSRLTKAKSLYNDHASLAAALADSYLEFNFGWRPLAFDIRDAYNGLGDRYRTLHVVPIKAHASGTYSGSSGLATVDGVDYPWLVNQKSHSKFTVRMKGAIRIYPVGDTMPVLDVLKLSTVKDFVTTAWDLLPYSFIVDYFANVGDVISALTLNFADLAWGVETRRTLTESEFGISFDEAFQPPVGRRWRNKFKHGGNSKTRCITFQRDAIYAPDLLPTFRLNLPVSSKPWVNIAALVVGGTHGLVPFYQKD